MGFWRCSSSFLLGPEVHRSCIAGQRYQIWPTTKTWSWEGSSLFWSSWWVLIGLAVGPHLHQKCSLFASPWPFLPPQFWCRQVAYLHGFLLRFAQVASDVFWRFGSFILKWWGWEAPTVCACAAGQSICIRCLDEPVGEFETAEAEHARSLFFESRKRRISWRGSYRSAKSRPSSAFGFVCVTVLSWDFININSHRLYFLVPRYNWQIHETCYWC